MISLPLPQLEGMNQEGRVSAAEMEWWCTVLTRCCGCRSLPYLNRSSDSSLPNPSRLWPSMRSLRAGVVLAQPLEALAVKRRAAPPGGGTRPCQMAVSEGGGCTGSRLAIISSMSLS